MKDLKQYRLKKDVSAPVANARRTGLIKPKIYKQGEIIKGYVHSSAVDGKSVIIADDKYALLSDNLEEIQDFQADGAQTTSTQIKNSDLPAEFKKQLDTLKNENVVTKIVKRSKNSVNGMLIGAGLGFILGLYFKKGIFIPTVLGATAGGFIGNSISPKEKKPMPDELKPKVAELQQTEGPKLTVSSALTQTNKI